MSFRALAARFSAVLFVALGVLGIVPAAPAHAATPVLGGGSGFAALEIDQWRADTARSPYNLNINYVAQGSTYGRNQFGGGAFDYGATDIEYPPPEKSSLANGRCGSHSPDDGSCFVYVPVSAGGVAFMYNLTDSSGARINNLRLSREAVCKIFTGGIVKWNDPAIVALNPRLASNSRPVRPVVREDGAGESYVFSEFCKAVEPGIWSAFINQQIHSSNTNLDEEFTKGHPTSRWPAADWANGAQPTPVAYADGTANYVADPSGGNGAITYVAAGYAKVRNFPTASVQNAAGAYTQPDENNVTIALGYATARGNGTFNLSYNGPDSRAYFPSTYSYVMVPTTGFDKGKGATLATFLCYAISKGQVIAPDLRYARLSSKLVEIAINAIIHIPGVLEKAKCFASDVPPPPPPPSCAGCNTGGGSGIGPNGNTGTGPGGTGSNGSGSTANPKNLTAQQKAKVAAALKAAEEKAAANGGAVTSSDGTTSNSAENLAQQLKNAAASTPTASSSSSGTLWLLLAGVVIAALVNALVSRRKTS